MNTITCEECGYVGPSKDFVWFQGEVAICRNGDDCRERSARKESGPYKLVQCSTCGQTIRVADAIWDREHNTFTCGSLIICQHRQEELKK